MYKESKQEVMPLAISTYCFNKHVVRNVYSIEKYSKKSYANLTVFISNTRNPASRASKRLGLESYLYSDLGGPCIFLT